MTSIPLADTAFVISVLATALAGMLAEAADLERLAAFCLGIAAGGVAVRMAWDWAAARPWRFRR